MIHIFRMEVALPTFSYTLNFALSKLHYSLTVIRIDCRTCMYIWYDNFENDKFNCDKLDLTFLNIRIIFKIVTPERQDKY